MTTDEVMNEFKTYLKDDSSDEALNLTKHISEKLKDAGETEKWKNKYTENDKAWRIKYRNTFLSTDYTKRDEGERQQDEDKEEKKTFESLFKMEG